MTTLDAKVYLVGGAVRDELMGLVPKDNDYVVVGSTPEKMLESGFIKVGADFPVFLHPETKEEYALARTERKTGLGYSGFDCEWEGVTIEEDLSRRDLTINSIAKDICTGDIVDPFGGVDDIKNKVLRPTTKAFMEDPLRVLRAARFMARLPEFSSDYEDRLFKYSEEVQYELLYYLTPERVWVETEKALSEKKPSRYFDWLRWFLVFSEVVDLNFTPQREDHHPEGDVGTHTMMVIDYAASQYNDPEITFACLTHDFGKPICWVQYKNAHGHEEEGLPIINRFCDRWKVPNRYRELALLVCKYHTKIHGVLGRGTQKMTKPKSIMKLFESTSALTKQDRFEKVLKACVADARGRGKTQEQVKAFEEKPYPQQEYLLECLCAVKKVDTKKISQEMIVKGKEGVMIGEAIRVERINAIRGVYNKWKNK